MSEVPVERSTNHSATAWRAALRKIVRLFSSLWPSRGRTDEVEADSPGSYQLHPVEPSSIESGDKSNSSGISQSDPSHMSRAENEAEIASLNQALTEFRVLEFIGQGGQGVVYKAVQKSTGRLVALKLLNERSIHSKRRQERFEREIELVARLRHPNIVTVYHSGIVGGRPYFAMEFIDGVTIDDYVLLHRPPIKTTLKLFKKVCLAVAGVHQRGVIHRDLKPGNMRVDLDGEPKVLDFGLAKSFMGEDRSLSIEGQRLGTPLFWSPEQAAGDEDGIDTRSDIYSLGVTLYYLLAGRMPYPIHGPPQSIEHHIIHTLPRPLDRLDGQCNDLSQAIRIDDELSHVVLKALSKEKERRYQSADAFAADIARYLEGDVVEAKADSAMYLFRRTMRRYKAHVAVAATFLVLVVSALIVITVQWQRAERIGRLTKAALIQGAFLREADTFRNQGRPDEAIALYKKVIEVEKEIADQDPRIVAFLCRAHLGLVRQYIGINRELTAAQGHSEEAVRLAAQLVASEPANIDFGRLQAQCYMNQGKLAATSGDYKRASEVTLHAVEIYDSVVARDLQNPELRYDAEQCRSELGSDLRYRGAWEEAFEVLSKARSGLISLCDAHPDIIEYTYELAATESDMGACLLEPDSAQGNLLSAEFLAAARNRLDRAVKAGTAQSRFFDVNLQIGDIETNMDLVLQREQGILSE